MGKIYTKKGDRGKTNLFGGRKVAKSNPLIEACGAIDELSSMIGVSLSVLNDKKDKLLLSQIQKDLYKIMAFISGDKRPIMSLVKKINFIEQYMDKTLLQLPNLNGFILAQGGIATAQLHLTRTVCRRAERRVVFLLQGENMDGKLNKKDLLMAVKYLNRLSDFFFVIARKYASQELMAKSNN